MTQILPIKQSVSCDKLSRFLPLIVWCCQNEVTNVAIVEMSRIKRFGLILVNLGWCASGVIAGETAFAQSTVTNRSLCDPNYPEEPSLLLRALPAPIPFYPASRSQSLLPTLNANTGVAAQIYSLIEQGQVSGALQRVPTNADLPFKLWVMNLAYPKTATIDDVFQVIRLAQTISDDYRHDNELESFADILLHRGKFTKAKPVIQAIRQIQRRQIIGGKMAIALLKAGNLPQALEISQWIDREKDFSIVEEVLKQLAKDGQTAKAVEIANQPEYLENKDTLLRAISTTLARQQDFAGAMQVAQTIQGCYSRSHTLIAIAEQQQIFDQAALSFSTLKEALPVVQRIAPKSYQISFLLDIIRLYREKGAVAEALPLLPLAIESTKISTSTDLYASPSFLTQIAREYRLLGQTSTARSILAQALRKAQNITERYSKSSELDAIATEYQQLGDQTLASQLRTQANKLYPPLPKVPPTFTIPIRIPSPPPSLKVPSASPLRIPKS